MNYSKNIRYFKSSDLHFYIGLALLAVGVILVLLGWFFWIYFLPFQQGIGLALALVGAIIAWVPRALRADEKDLDACIETAVKEYSDSVLDYVGVSKTSGIVPLMVGGHEFEADGILMRRGKDDRKFRSSLYTAAAFVFTGKGLCVCCKTFSLVDSTVRDSRKDFTYQELDGVSIVNESKKLDGVTTTVVGLAISVGGKEVMRVPASQSAVLDKLCEDINRTIAGEKARLA